MNAKTPILDRSQQMDERSWWDLWNTSYRTKDDNDPVSSELFKRVSAVINKLVQTGTRRVLEIGCGAGRLSRLLAYSSYHGLDLSPAAIDLACQKRKQISAPASASPATYEVADFHDWPLPERPYDVVVCIDAVAYFRDQQFALNKIAQSLRISGTLVLTTINPFVYWRIRRNWENGPVSHWLSRRELHTLVKQAGLKIERSYTIMPRGNLGILRLVNSPRLNDVFGPRFAAAIRRVKEHAGFGQYRVVVARRAG